VKRVLMGTFNPKGHRVGAGWLAPDWFLCGMASVYRRQVDTRWTDAEFYPWKPDEEDEYLWRERIVDIAKQDTSASLKALFDMDHVSSWDATISAWSKADYMLEERRKELVAWFKEISRPDFTDESEQWKLMGERQTEALLEHFGETPLEFDEQWTRWARRHYRKR